MLVGTKLRRVGLGTCSTALALVGCQSGQTTAPVTNTVTSVLNSAVTQTATVTTTVTIAGPYVTVMRTTTKPAPPPVTKVIIKTNITTVTKTPEITTTADVPSTEESTADDGGADRLARAEQAADDIQEAATTAGWTGPICDPDVNLHRKEAGQDLLGDNQLADTCEANVEKAKTQIADNPPSEDPRPDPTTVQDTVQDSYDHIRKVLGITRNPSSGEVQLVNGCEAHDPNFTADLCGIVHEEWDN